MVLDFNNGRIYRKRTLIRIDRIGYYFYPLYNHDLEGHKAAIGGAVKMITDFVYLDGNVEIRMLKEKNEYDFELLLEMIHQYANKEIRGKMYKHFVIPAKR